MDDQDWELLQKKIKASQHGVWFVGRWLSNRGYDIYIPTQHIAEKPEDRLMYSDHGDLYRRLSGTNEWFRIESKQLRRNFTGIKDWPFGDDFIVCSKEAFDHAKPKPILFYIISHHERAMAIVDVATYPTWTYAKRKDKTYRDVEQDYYFCPIELVEWLPVDPREIYGRG